MAPPTSRSGSPSGILPIDVVRHSAAPDLKKTGRDRPRSLVELLELVYVYGLSRRSRHAPTRTTGSRFTVTS